jgi:hypothetical protein
LFSDSLINGSLIKVQKDQELLEQISSTAVQDYTS